VTCLEKLCRANRWRIRAANPDKPSKIASTDADGWNGSFMVPLEGEMWYVVLNDQLGWRHLAIANAQKNLTPTWSVMCRVKQLFYGDDEWACQFHPPKDEHGISDFPYRLHLWSPLEETLPVPVMVVI
jgi:hypothetical protein